MMWRDAATGGRKLNEALRPPLKWHFGTGPVSWKMLTNQFCCSGPSMQSFRPFETAAVIAEA
jgi:hypothetical protein